VEFYSEIIHLHVVILDTQNMLLLVVYIVVCVR